MDWILAHLQVLFAVAIAVVAILQKLKAPRPGEEPPGTPEGNPADAERTRRIQEEIRRRIMERRGLLPVAPPREVAEAAPVYSEAPPMIAEVRPLVAAAPRLEAAEMAEVPGRSPELERQQRLIEQFRELEASRQASTVTGPGPAAGGTAPENRLRPDLRGPARLRRAVVLREILGPPVGLR